MIKYTKDVEKTQAVSKNKKGKLTEKVNEYKEKKIRTVEISKFTKKNFTKKSQESICECGSWFTLLSDKEEEKLKKHNSVSCKNRFCPNCAWATSKKEALQLAIAMKHIEQQGKSFIFITLTAPNVRAEELPEEITKFNKAFKKLVERKDVKKANQGYVRKLEVTYDKEPRITKSLYKKKKAYYDIRGLGVGDDNPTYNTYHPHFHVIMTVNKSYFSDRTYLSQEKWLNLWREAMDDFSITQVRVQKVSKGNTDGKKEGNAINEIAKYSAKDEDYGHSQEIFDVFYGALKGRQLITFNGLFKDAVAEYKVGLLDHLKDVDTVEYVKMISASWHVKNKDYETNTRELNEDDFADMKRQEEKIEKKNKKLQNEHEAKKAIKELKKQQKKQKKEAALSDGQALIDNNQAESYEQLTLDVPRVNDT